jgi:exonuclease VII small subunit
MFRNIHLKYKIEDIDHLEGILRDMNIPQKDIDKAVHIFVETVRADHMAHTLLNEVNKQLPESKKLSKDI